MSNALSELQAERGDFTGVRPEYADVREERRPEYASVREEKRVLRARLRTVERGLSGEYRRRADNAIVSALLSMDAYRRAETVCCFVGTGAEIDTRPFLLDALRRGKRLFTPLCIAPGVMEMRRITSLDELSPGTMGIPEPPRESELAEPYGIAFLVAPCLACDRAGNRLGRGGGYYDRFLSRCQGTVVLLCREALLRDSVPMEPHDVSVKLVLSERGLYRNGVL